MINIDYDTHARFCNSDPNLQSKIHYFWPFINLTNHIELSIKEIQKLGAEELEEKEFMLETLTQQKIKYGLTPDWLHFVALCGIFPPSVKGGIFKKWSKYEDLFIALVKEEGKIGVQHFLQAIVLYFIK